MKKSRFTDEQIVAALRDADATRCARMLREPSPPRRALPIRAKLASLVQRNHFQS